MVFQTLKNEDNLVISDLIDATTNDWDLVKINTLHLPPEAVDFLFLIGLNHLHTDNWVWRFSNTGTFNIKSCYIMLFNLKYASKLAQLQENIPV